MIISNMYDGFPDHIPIFPLSGVIYFPKTNLPLNIFEKRYLDLVNDVLVRLREAQVSSVSQNGYSSLIGALINDAKER